MSTDITSLSRLNPDEGNTMLGLFEDPRFPDRIIKMVETSNDGYFAYACWLLTNAPRNPHFLKVYAVELLDSCRALVTVERLQDGHDLDPSVAYYLGSVVSGYPYRTHENMVVPPLLDEAVSLIYQDLGKTWHGDLHNGNWMTRPDGTVVINDPLHRRKVF